MIAGYVHPFGHARLRRSIIRHRVLVTLTKGNRYSNDVLPLAHEWDKGT
jgi:hypothetical protein